MVSFIHAADLHLDSPLLGLTTDEFSPEIEEIRGATRQALENLVNLVLSEDVDLLLISGDLYDGDWKDFGTGLFFVRQMQRLERSNVKVAMVRGNHDAANAMTKSLNMPENVHVFSEKSPETLVLQELGVAIHGQSYPTREVMDNLALNFPDPVPELFNIGLLHCLLSGTTGHQPYAPCKRDHLLSKGYDYWALGHVHQCKLLNASPPIVYPGCTQGRHIKEQGAKGCILVDTNHSPLTPAFIPVDVLRWFSLELDISNHENYDQILQTFTTLFLETLEELDDRICCARVVLKGITPLHGQLKTDMEPLLANLKVTAGNLSHNRTLIEKIELTTTPEIDYDSISQSDTPQGELLQLLQELEQSQTPFQDLELDITPLQSKLLGLGITAQFDPSLLHDARDILLTLLAKIDDQGVK